MYNIRLPSESAGIIKGDLMTQEKDEKPKIIVDDDWKSQAEAEKEKLAEEVDKEGAEAPGAPKELPPADFATLVNSLAGQVLLALGGVEDPKTKRRYVDLGLAKHYVDMLSVLEEKTRGNLTDEEKQLLDQALYETRMRYVTMAQRV